MSPLRLIILGILFYAFYRLLSGGKEKPDQGANPTPDSPPLARDILVEDPVCHTYIPKGQAIHLHDGAEIHYFCSEQCRQTFTSTKGDRQ